MSVTINGTTGIAGVDGSANTPAVQGSDTNTGVFFPAADTVGVTTGGTERMRIDSSGNVGIGTSSPNGLIDVASNSNSTVRYYFRNANAGTGAYTILDLGNDTSNLRGELFVTSSGNTSSWGANSLVMSNSGAYPILFATNNAERMRIDSSGNVLINETSRWRGVGKLSITTGADDGIAVKTDSAGLIIRKLSYSNAFLCLFENSGGTQVGAITTNGTNTTYTTTSDYRLKENIASMSGALAIVNQLKPVTYSWKETGEVGQGFIAHELQAVVPDCVIGEKDAVDADGNPQYQGIDTSFLVATLTAALQELKALTDAQASTITTLTARITALEVK